jgi:hypothetical protein
MSRLKKIGQPDLRLLAEQFAAAIVDERDDDAWLFAAELLARIKRLKENSGS